MMDQLHKPQAKREMIRNTHSSLWLQTSIYTVGLPNQLHVLNLKYLRRSFFSDTFSSSVCVFVF